MTGQLIASAGLLSGPSYAFNGASKTGFYLAGTNQIGFAVNAVQAATINADTSVTFNGTVTALKGTVPVGAVMDFAGSTAPAGWLLCYGQQVSTTTYAALFAILGTTYGSGAGTFGIPDYRGRSGFGLDNMGGTPAGNINLISATILGNTGGSQSHTLTGTEIPTITSNGTNSISVSGAFPGSIPYTNGNIATFTTGAGGGSGNGPGGSNSWGNAGTSLSSSGSNSISVTSNNTGGGAHIILNPLIIINKIVYAGV